jgi:hypothetical protein
MVAQFGAAQELAQAASQEEQTAEVVAPAAAVTLGRTLLQIIFEHPALILRTVCE